VDDQLDVLVKSVLASAKYRHVSPAFIRAIGARELTHRPNLKSAIKATKNALHQAGGAFMDSPIDYHRALVKLQETSSNSEAFRDTCRLVMAGHTSTRERLPILENFFSTTLAGIPSPTRVLDLACGLNPLAYSWLPFPRETEYVAFDIYSDQIAFLNEFFQLDGLRGRAEMRDVIWQPPEEAADLALILKTLPCLEAIDKNAPTRLLDAVQASTLLVSFPAQSLGGRRKGMTAHYEARFQTLMAERGWPSERFEFATELAFLIKKP
jgi:16S rRNA (guanine(1405)-N(7))-methyltransferase